MAKGERYEVLVSGLGYPTDPDIIQRILDGASVPAHERKEKRPPVGAIVSDIPECSVPWMLAQGWIRRPVKGATAVETDTEDVTTPEDSRPVFMRPAATGGSEGVR